MTFDQINLRALLSKYDGRATSILTEIETVHADKDGFLDSLIGMVGDKDAIQSDGSTWLISSWLKQKKPISAVQTGNLVRRVELISSWQSQLHVCQSIKYLTIEASDASLVCVWLASFLRHKRPFLRAWSLDALVAIKKNHGIHSELATKALNHALDDEAASVRARARSLL